MIISYSYPPLNNIAARRFSEMIPYFGDQGWEPYVLTTNSEGDLNTYLNEDNIIRIGHHPQKNIMGKSRLINRRKLRHRLGISSRTLDSTYNWYKEVINKENLKRLEKYKFDLILASYSPSASLFLGNQLSKKLSVPWIADFRDLGALHKDSYDIRNFVFQFLDKVIERNIVKNASYITTVSYGLKEELKKYYKQSIAVIYNGWKEANQTSSANTMDKRQIPYIYYAGRFYEHQLDALILLLDALKDCPIELVIRSLGPEHLTHRIEKIAEKKEVINKLKILPPAESVIIKQEEEAALINLVLEDLDKTHKFKRGVLTGKLMQLFPSSPPILAIARDDSEIGAVLLKSKKGKLVSTKQDIIGFVNQIMNSTYEKWQYNDILPFSKENQAKKLIKVFNKVEKSPKEKI